MTAPIYRAPRVTVTDMGENFFALRLEAGDYKWDAEQDVSAANVPAISEMMGHAMHAEGIPTKGLAIWPPPDVDPHRAAMICWVIAESIERGWRKAASTH